MKDRKRLFVMRHAAAEAGERNDPDRKVTPEGLRNLAIMYDFFRAEKVRPNIVASSTFRRSRDTADYLIDSILHDGGSVRLVVSDLLTPETPGNTSARFAQSLFTSDQDQVLMIGHQPNLDAMLAYILDLPRDPSVVQFKHSAVVRVDLDALLEDGGTANRVRWFATPKLVRRLI